MVGGNLMQKARHTGSCRDQNGEGELEEVIGHKMGQQALLEGGYNMTDCADA